MTLCIILVHMSSAWLWNPRHSEKDELPAPLENCCSLLVPISLNLDIQGCLVQVGNGIELEAVGLQFKLYLWLPCGVTWDSS